MTTKVDDFTISDRDEKVLTLLESIDSDCLNEMEKIVRKDERRRGDWYQSIGIEDTSLVTEFVHHSKDTFDRHIVRFINSLGHEIGAYPLEIQVVFEKWYPETDEFEETYEVEDSDSMLVSKDSDLTPDDMQEFVSGWI